MKRAFGKIRKRERAGRRPSYEASYNPPDWAYEKWPWLTKTITKSFNASMRLQAEAWLAQAKKDIDYGVWQPPTLTAVQDKAKTITFREYATEWVKNRRKPNGRPIARTTRDKYTEYLENHLIPAFGDLPLESVSYRRIKEWWDDFPVQSGGYGESGRQHVYTILHAILESAVRDPLDDEGTTLLTVNPAKIKTTKPKRRQKPVIAEISELEIIREAMPPRLALAIDLGGDRDLREGEICGLQRRDLDFNARKIHIRHAVKSVKDGKGRRELLFDGPKTDNSVRDVDMTDYIIPRLQAHLDVYVADDPEAMLFTAPRTGGLLAPQSLRNAWYRARKSVPRLEQSKMKFHDLRNTSLTRMVESGAPLGLVMEQGGHSTVEIAAIYQQVSESKRQEVLENLSKAHADAEEESIKPVATQGDSIVAQLQQLASLHETGILDDEEFAAAKRKILSS